MYHRQPTLEIVAVSERAPATDAALTSIATLSAQQQVWQSSNARRRSRMVYEARDRVAGIDTESIALAHE